MENKKVNDGGPAFPFAYQNVDEFGINDAGEVLGLTKREYFAAMAMQALYSNPNSFWKGPKECAKDARSAADALIAELGKGNPNA